MPTRLKAKIKTQTSPMRWLLNPCADVPQEAHAYMLGQLVSSPVAIIMASINSLLVSSLGFFRQDGQIFGMFLAAECSMLMLRLAVILHVRGMVRAGNVPSVDLAVLCSIVWCALQGTLAFVIMQRGDTVTMVVAATLIMGIVGPICARNYPAPRLALLLVCLCDIPFKAGSVSSGNPWFLILLLMTPPFILGAMQIVLTFQETLLLTLRAESKNQYLAQHDVLTGLLNRNGLNNAIGTLQGPRNAIAILGADLDGFKQANDHFGHAAGDELLRAVGARLVANLRAEDLVARIGGDEFLIVVKNMPPNAVGEVAERLVESIADEKFTINGQEIVVGMSLGYACYPEDADDIEELRLRADHALYAVKRSGKGLMQRYTSAMSVATAEFLR